MPNVKGRRRHTKIIDSNLYLFITPSSIRKRHIWAGSIAILDLIFPGWTSTTFVSDHQAGCVSSFFNITALSISPLLPCFSSSFYLLRHPKFPSWIVAGVSNIGRIIMKCPFIRMSIYSVGPNSYSSLEYNTAEIAIILFG